MKELVLFSLKRRFLNKTHKSLMVLLLCLFVAGAFLDKIVDFFTEDQATLKVALENIDESLFLMNNSDIVIDKQASLKISLDGNVYQVASQQPLSQMEKIQLEALIYPYYQQTLNPKIQEVLVQYRHPQINYTFKEASNIQQKHDNLFMVITSIYFMMLGFAGMLASEVVAEKTSNILELIGTSVSLKTHYYSKIIIGWCSILFQFISMGFLVFVALSLRFLVDRGQGLIAFLNRLKLIQVDFESFDQALGLLLNQKQALFDLGLALLFLFIGILVVQLILVVISTKVITIEEAGALQNPFYMGLLFLYYGALILNNPESMSVGWGFRLSFVPIFSMIFMPMRLMLFKVSVRQIVIGLMINLFFLMFIIKVGEKRYVLQVLNFSSKSNVKKVKKYEGSVKCEIMNKINQVFHKEKPTK